MKKHKCILVDTEKGISCVNFDFSNYKNITKALKCEYIECVTRMINGVRVDIYCDEEALIRGVELKPSIVTTDDSKVVEAIYNNVLICWHDKQGFVKDMKKDAIDKVIASKRTVQDDKGNRYVILQSTLL